MKSIYKLLLERIVGITLATGCGSVTQSIESNRNIYNKDIYECVEESDGVFSPKKRIVVGTIPIPQYQSGRDPHSVTHNENEQQRNEAALAYCTEAFRRRNSNNSSIPRVATPLAQTSRNDLEKYEHEQTQRNGQGVEKAKHIADAEKERTEGKDKDFKIAREETKQDREHSVRLVNAKTNVHYGPAGGSVAMTIPPAVGAPIINNVGYGGGTTAWVDRERREQYLSPSLTEDLKKKLSLIEKEGEISGYRVEKVGTVYFEDCQFTDGKGIDAVAEALRRVELQDRTIILHGSADTRSAKNCGSQTNPDLAGHRAVSTLIDLEKKLEAKIYEAHVDIIAGGTTLNQRSVSVYLIKEKGKSLGTK